MPTQHRAVLLLPLWLAACQGEADTTPAPSNTDTPAWPTEVGGDRPTEVIRPVDAQPGEALPLVVMLHGYSSWGDDTDKIFGLRERVDRDRFLLVMPDGTTDFTGNQFWNATDDCCNWFGADVDDVAYLSGLIAEVRAGYDVTTVAVVGHSNGAYMAYRLACEHPELMDRLIPFSGAVPRDEVACAEGPLPPLMDVHGTYDEIIGYAPYDGTFGGVATVGAVETVRRYAARAHCSAAISPIGEANLASSIRGDETRGIGYDDCDVPVTLWTVEGGYHLFLDATDELKDGVTAFALGGEPVF